MDKKDLLISRLKQLTEAHLGHGCHTPGDFDKLIIKIEKITGEKISQSTLKRLWGYVAYPHTPSVTVLSILARFNGFSDWADFCKTPDGPQTPAVAQSDSSFLSPEATATSAMTEGEQVRFEWGRTKSCTIEKIGAETFRVISSANIKLRAGDIIIAPLFGLGKPFYASAIRRDGKPIGAYIAARDKGIDSIIRITPKDEE